MRALKPNPQESLELGKIPPQSVEAEEMVLGACLLGGHAADEIPFLKPLHFYKEGHQKIFSAICHLRNSHEPVDMVLVMNVLRKKEELEISGGPYYLAQLTNRISSSANIVEHARLIIEKYVARSVITISSIALRDAYDDSTDIFELASQVVTDMDNLTSSTIQKGIRKAEDANKETIKELKELSRVIDRKEILGIPSGIMDLDEKTGGFMPGKLIVLGARTSMGKTALALTMARYAVKKNIPTLLFSLEMNDFDLMKRFNAMDLGINLSKFVSRGPDAQELESVIRHDKEIAKLPLYFVDSISDIDSIQSIIKSAVHKHGIKYVIIDYLQLVKAPTVAKKGALREAEVAHVSRTLKLLTMSLKIPILSLAQLRREGTTQGAKPRLSDLRESGAIEMDADMVLFIYRAEVYADEKKEDHTDKEGFTELMIAKHRNGPCSSAYAYFDRKTTKFTDWNRKTENVQKQEEPLPF
jgi:replicative DNA helicase